MDLAASLEHTLHQEARRNELRIAYVRAFAAFAVALMDVLAYVAPETTGVHDMSPTVVIFAGLAVVATVLILFGLRVGWYAAFLPVVLPIFDGLLITGSFAVLMQTSAGANVAGSGSMTNAAALCTLLAMSGGLRLSRAAVAAATVAGVGTWACIGVWSGIAPGAVVFIALAVAAGGGLGYFVSGMVRRTARAEVERTIVQRFLPGPVVGDAANPLAVVTTPRTAHATVLVSDLRGFTAAAEGMEAEQVLAFLNEFQGELAEIVRAHGGTVDKFMGDGLLAVFGAIEPAEDHAARAVAAGVEMIDAMAKTKLRIGVGIHSGDLVVGCLGSGARLELTILGDTVNTASRLEGKTKELAVPLLVSAATAALLSKGQRAPLIDVGEVDIRGRKAKLHVFQLAASD